MSDLFSIGRSGLGAAKRSLQTSSHNIANANTEGYSRQRVELQSSTPVGHGKHIQGTGVQVKSIKRIHDQHIQRKLNETITKHNYNEEQTLQLSQVEAVFNEINSEGLNKILNRFFNSFRELSNQPENETVRAIVRDNAKIVANDFNRIHTELIDAKDRINRKIQGSIETINNLSERVAYLNKQIVKLETAGGETGDLRDQRDMAVSSLAEFFDIESYEDDYGQMTVNVQGAGSIVSGGQNIKLVANYEVNKQSDSSDRAEMQIYFDGRSNPITKSIRSGSLSALILSRDRDVGELEDRMNELAYGLVKATNAIHRRGYINGKIPTDQNGNPVNLPGSRKVTGINFFKEPLDKKNAAELIALSTEVLSDLNNISTGLTPNTPGDNRIAIAISKLQHEKLLKGGTTTFEETYQKAVGLVGTRTAKSRIDTEQSEGILAQAKSIKERLTGVSIDEETANMVRYQHAYDASAKVIKTADEMFDSLIGMMR